MHLLLVEDERLVADAFQVMLLEAEPDIRVTTCYSAQHALSTVDTGADIDIVLTDLHMPGIGGLGLLDALRNRRRDLPVLVISAMDDERSVRSAMDRGAAGFIPKALPGAELIAGVREVAAGRRFYPERCLTSPAATGPAGAASRRHTGDPCSTAARPFRPGAKQMQVLRLMADGHSNKQISQIVGIKEATVKYHASQLFKQLGVKNRTSCVREAQGRGLVDAFGTHPDAEGTERPDAPPSRRGP